MITGLRLTGSSIINLPIVGALPSDIYILKSVDGLGPPEVNVSIADTPNAGSIYLGSRPQRREIVALVGLNPDFSTGQTASDLRSSLYGLLSPGLGNSVLVEVMDDTDVVVKTIGYTKKLEINPFTKDPEVQVTIDCIQSYLDGPGLVYTAPASKTAPVINNPGEVAVGFHMETVLTANAANWKLTNDENGEFLGMYGGGSGWFITGDTFTFDTRPGYRGAWLTRAGFKTIIIGGMIEDSSWLLLQPGDNNFTMSYTSSYNWGDVYHQPAYWGI